MENVMLSAEKPADPQIGNGVITLETLEEDLSLIPESGRLLSEDSEKEQRGNPPAADAVQYVYLDFDGEETRYRNRELGLDFAVTVKDSGFSEEEKQYIWSELTSKYDDIVFTLDKPANDAVRFSTVFIGKSSDFEEYGAFLGLAETIDAGNQIKDDNAFVFLDRTADLSQVISVTDHELGHILSGEMHEVSIGEIEDYAFYYSHSASLKVVNSFPLEQHYNLSISSSGNYTINVSTQYKSYITVALSYINSTGAHRSPITVNTDNNIYFNIAENRQYEILVMSNSTTPKFLEVPFTITIKDASGGGGGTVVSLPDVQVGSLQLSSTAIKTNDPLNVTFSVKNGSSVQAADVTASVYDGSQLLQSFSLGNLASGGTISKTYTVSAGILSAGSHNITVRVSCQNDSDSSNNSKSATVSVSTALPDLYFNTVYTELAGGLSNQTIFNPEDTIRFHFGVKNKGDAYAPEMKISLKVGNAVRSQISDSGLGKNELLTLGGYFDIPASEIGEGGVYTATWTVNSDNAIAEYSTVNNTATCTITIERDTVPPEAPQVHADITTATNRDVTLYADYSSDSVTRQYSFDCTTWYTYQTGVVVNTNGVVYFRGIDSAGNASKVTAYRVNNIMAMVPEGGAVKIYTNDVLTYTGNRITDGILEAEPLMSCVMQVSSGGEAIRTRVGARGYLHVSNGGMVDSTAVNSSGYLLVSSGGTADSTTVNSGGRMHISSGGTADSTIVNSSGWVYVSSGGTADSTIVNSSGWVYVSSGGTADSTTVNCSGVLKVCRSGTADSITVNPGGMLLVDGGMTNSAMLNSGGIMFIFSGTANSTTVNLGAMLFVSSGGTALQIRENGGDVIVYDDANVTFAPNSFAGLVLNRWQYATVHSGTTANSTTINSGGELHISSGGTADSVIVNSGGGLLVSCGGVIRGSLQLMDDAVVSAYAGAVINFTVDGRTINNGYLINNLSLISGTPNFTITVSGFQSEGTYKLAQGASHISGSFSIGTETIDFGSITVNGSAVSFRRRDYQLIKTDGNLTLRISKNADSILVYSSGRVVRRGDAFVGEKLVNGGSNSMTVFDGGTASGTIINNGGRMDVALWGMAKETVINNGGAVVLSSGALASATTVNSGGGLHVYSGATASRTTVNQSGYLGVGGGATVVSTTVGEIGEVTIWGGGVASQSVIKTWGAMILSSGARADGTIINDKGGLHVYSGAVADHTTVNQGGIFGVGDGAVVNDTDIGVYGELTVWGGGVANRTDIASGGALILLSGAVASGTDIQANGGLHVYSGARADNTLVNQFGYFGVGDGAVVNSTAIGDYGELKVWGGGVANRTDIAAGGALILLSGAQASGTEIQSGGGLHVYSGARASGTTVYQGGFFGVGGGALVVSTTVGEAGEVIVWGGGYALDNVIETWGAMILSSGARADRTDIHVNGGLHIYAGAQADAVTIREGATLGIGSAGKVDTVIEEHGAGMVFYDGAQVSGRIQMGGTVTVNGVLDGSNAVFVFDLTNRTTGDGIIMNSMQLVTNTSFQVSVSSSQQAGWYALAGGAYRTTLTVNVDSAAAGSISVGGSALQVGNNFYSLGLSNGVLSLGISKGSVQNSARLLESPEFWPAESMPALDSFSAAADPLASTVGDWDNGLDPADFNGLTSWDAAAFLSDADIPKLDPGCRTVPGMIA